MKQVGSHHVLHMYWDVSSCGEAFSKCQCWQSDTCRFNCSQMHGSQAWTQSKHLKIHQKVCFQRHASLSEGMQGCHDQNQQILACLGSGLIWQHLCGCGYSLEAWESCPSSRHFLEGSEAVCHLFPLEHEATAMKYWPYQVTSASLTDQCV